MKDLLCLILLNPIKIFIMEFKIKIFFPIGAFYPSQIGGPCNSLYWHTYGLNKHGIKIDIVTTTIGIKKG